MTTPLVFSGVSWAPPSRTEPLFVGLDLELAGGDLVVLTCGLGGGKSSALRLAVGLERPWTGSVQVCGRPPAEVRDRIGYVGGDGSLLSNLSLRDNLVLPLRWLRDPPAAEVERKAAEVLDLFGIVELPAIAPAYAPTNLRRLVALARALILDPTLLVLDDPAADFDDESAEEVWLHLLDIARMRGLAILAAATEPPRLAACRVVTLTGTAIPATRRFSSGKTSLLPVVRPPAVHPDIIARRHS